MTIAREMVLKDIAVAESDEGKEYHSVETSEFTFSLPDIMQYPEDLKAFLYKELIETSTLVSLEQEGQSFCL